MSDLWIVPPSSHSAWFSRLDWYLNWQMCKGLAHRNGPPPAEVFRLAEEHSIKIDSSNIDGHAPLMISGQGLIPAKACVVIGFKGELKDWLAQAKTIAFQMQADNARVYLPAGAKRSQAVGIWDKLTGRCAAEFMEDE